MVAIAIGGTAGAGVESAGTILARVFAKAGFPVTTGRVFPSRIRGGDTTFTVRLSEYLAPASKVELGFVLNDTVHSIMPACEILIGPGGVDVDLAALGSKMQANVVAVGIILGALGLEPELAEAELVEQFGRKGEEVIAGNWAALQAGHQWARAQEWPSIPLPAPNSGHVRLLTGNQVASMGALAAGCRFVAAYPITPASDILEFMTPYLVESGGVAVQLEDEMAALNACIGAGFAGAAAMTATSGPGLSLMTESLGFAGTAEVPLVLVDCQRPGPSTGMPTKQGQEDLLHAVLGGHGEDLRIVVAPTSIHDSFAIMIEAFALARQWRLPVIVLLDQQLSLMAASIPEFALDAVAEQVPALVHDKEGSAWDGTYLNYDGNGRELAQSHSIPGLSPSLYYSNSTEHAPSGFTNENPTIRAKMVERRLRRLGAIAANHPQPFTLSGAASDAILVSFGSTLDACLEAANLVDFPVQVLGIRLLHPLPISAIEQMLLGKQIFCVEANATGQLASLLCQQLPIHDGLRRVLRYDGTPVTANDVVAELTAWRKEARA